VVQLYYEFEEEKKEKIFIDLFFREEKLTHSESKLSMWENCKRLRSGMTEADSEVVGSWTTWW
jgi:hypothetical protein